MLVTFRSRVGRVFVGSVAPADPITFSAPMTNFRSPGLAGRPLGSYANAMLCSPPVPIQSWKCRSLLVPKTLIVSSCPIRFGPVCSGLWNASEP